MPIRPSSPRLPAERGVDAWLSTYSITAVPARAQNRCRPDAEGLRVAHFRTVESRGHARREAGARSLWFGRLLYSLLYAVSAGFGPVTQE
jgi:hypothetical protein